MLVLSSAVARASTAGRDELEGLRYLVVVMSVVSVPLKLSQAVAFARPRAWNLAFVPLWMVVATLLGRGLN